MPAFQFYKDLVALDRRQHARLKFTAGARLAFSADLVVVPVMPAEWGPMARQCPIAFLPQAGQAPLPVAVVGPPDGRNLWLDRKGHWTGPYVPAFLRRYPFALVATGGDQLTLCIDRACKGFSEKAGVPLFEADGAPSPLLQDALQMLAGLQRQQAAGQAFAARLQACGLLVDADAETGTADGRGATLPGLQVVDEGLLRALPPAQVLTAFGNGDLALVHAHLLSLGHLPELLRRQPAAARTTTH